MDLAQQLFGAVLRGLLRASPFTTIGASMTLSSTVRCGNRLKPWNTMPTCARNVRARLAAARSHGSDAFLRLMAMPSTVIEPLSGISRKFRQRSNVDLPQPDGPMIDTRSPSAMSSDMPLRTVPSP
jgi:hypothetical protein